MECLHISIGAVAAVGLVPVHNGDMERNQVSTAWSEVLRIRKFRKAATQNSLKQYLQEAECAQAGRKYINIDQYLSLATQCLNL